MSESFLRPSYPRNPDSIGQEHPDEDQLALLIEGNISKKVRKLLETHLVECEVCRDVVADSIQAIQRVEAGIGTKKERSLGKLKELIEFLLISKRAAAIFLLSLFLLFCAGVFVACTFLSGETRAAKENEQIAKKEARVAQIAAMNASEDARKALETADRVKRVLTEKEKLALLQFRSEIARGFDHLKKGRIQLAFEKFDWAEKHARNLFPSITPEDLEIVGVNGMLKIVGLPLSATVKLEKLAFEDFFIPDDKQKREKTIIIRTPFSTKLKYGCYRVTVEAQGYRTIDKDSYLFILPRNTDPYYVCYHKRNIQFHLQKEGQLPKGMVFVPAGDFLMGTNHREDHGPRRIAFSDSFLVDKIQVTIRDFMKHAGAIDYKGRKFPKELDDFPMMCLTWFEATAYAKKIGKRLLTEAEWEKAAAGVRGDAWPWGNELNADWVSKYVVSDRRHPPASDLYSRYTPEDWHALRKKMTFDVHYPVPAHWILHYVGSGAEVLSPFGCLHMHGNVGEWVNAWYDKYPNSNPRVEYAHEMGKVFKVYRGGSYIHSPIQTRSQHRSREYATKRLTYIGLRCGMDVK